MTQHGSGPEFRRGMGPRDPTEAAGWEVEHHLAELADRLVEEGVAPGEARREAERRFGSPRGYRSRLEQSERRRRTTMRRMAVWWTMRAGMSGAARTLRRSPGFATGVVLTLALGIGANATMFGVLDRLLFSPPEHVVEPDAVRRVVVESPALGQWRRGENVTHPDWMDLEPAGSFEAVAALSRSREYTLGSGPDATRVRAAMASWDFFPLLGVRAAHGRFYGEAEDRVGADGVAVISHEYWQRVYGGVREVLGRTLRLSGYAFTVIGVAPPGFTGVDLTRVDVWLPLMSAGTIINGMQWEGNRGWYWFGAVVRLAPDVDVAAAEEEATALHRNGRRDMIEQDRYPAEASIALDPLIAARGPEASGESRVARWLGGVSLLVLLIACANVANLLLARGTRRRRELAVRLALGVGRGRLVSTMVVECILLALLGGAVALVVALWAGGVVRGTLLPGVYFPGSAVGGRVLLFAGAAALLAGVLAGFAPALQATRADLAGDLAMGAGVGSTRRSRTRAALTILQGALSVVLLVGAGLFVRSASRVHDLDLGLDVDRLVVATLEFEGDGTFLGTRADALPDVSEEQARNDIYRAAMERVLHEPGVEAATTTSSPFGWAFATSLEVPGLDSIPRLAGGGPYFQDVTPEYLRTVGLRVTRGRDLAESDAHGTPPVTMVSETMARTLWPDEDPLGKCMLVGDGATRCTTVVGVVEDASRGSLEEDPYMAYYMPLAQRDGRQANALYLRVSGDASEVAARVAPILRGIDPRVRFASVTPLREQLDPQARAWTLGAMMFSVFGALALIVAAIGLYGVLAFDIAQRTRELGIRAALGAERGRLLRSVVAAGVRLGAAGVTLGLLVAWFAGRFASDLLFHTSPHDPQVLIGVAGALLAVSIAASFVPGVRATHIDPSEALRVE